MEVGHARGTVTDQHRLGRGAVATHPNLTPLPFVPNFPSHKTPIPTDVSLSITGPLQSLSIVMF